MNLPTFKVAFATAFVLLVTMVSVGQKANISDKMPYVRSGSEASLSGIISYKGAQPKRLKIDMTADPVCDEANPDSKTDAVRIDNERLANVLIFVKSTGLAAYSFKPPTSPAVLDHKDCYYAPQMLGMQAGQPLEILNSDRTQHNTHPRPKSNKEWNMSQGVGSPPISKTFDKPELIPFTCNMHPWEKAYVAVFTHPFFAISDAMGNYKIEGLPPGQYTLVAWHERLGEKTMELVLIPGESKEQAFTFDGEIQ